MTQGFEFTLILVMRLQKITGGRGIPLYYFSQLMQKNMSIVHFVIKAPKLVQMIVTTYSAVN